MDKELLRVFMLRKRNYVHTRALKTYSYHIFLNYLKFYQNLKITKDKVVAGYYPIQSEANDLFILNYLRYKRHKVVLPMVTHNSRVLLFGDINNYLINGKFGIKQPINKILLKPSVILTPLIAFDEYGNRVGYGGGYYDTTLNYYKSINHNVLYVGIAYSFQKTDQLIKTKAHDVKLDAILTDKYFKLFKT